ncbi:MAG TPA: protein kinase [Chthoniobacter sp.]|nr:protein kinase [Chthoniobacter sp.]
MTDHGTSRHSARAINDDAFESPTIPAPAVTKPATVPKTYGHYAIEHRPDGSPWMLGRGGMGVTFKAMDTNLRCPVALKIIGPQCFGGERSERCFIREAQLAAQIRHPNVAAIHHLDSQDGEFFYAMEYVDGISADAWVRQRGPMSVDLALDIVMQVTRAITAAEQLKVLHRDIKPGNIMIVPDPANPNRVIAKLIDFGLARSAAGEASPTATTCGFTGTPQFASPEQAENLQLDVRSDIYSLGSTLWYFLVGEAPFVGTPARVIAQLLTAEPPWERVQDLPKEIKGLLRTMLAKSPEDRPQTPVALHNHIMACREKLAQHPAGRNRTKRTSTLASVRLNGRSLALAGGLALVLVWLALSPHAHDESQTTQGVTLKKSDAAFAPPRHAPAPAPQEVVDPPAPVKSVAPPPPPAEQVAMETNPLPDFAPVTVDLTSSDPPSDSFSLATGSPDPQAMADLEQPGPVSLSIGGLEPEDQATPAATTPVAKAGDQRGSDHRRGSRQQHRASPWQPINRVRGSVEGLIRHFF